MAIFRNYDLYIGRKCFVDNDFDEAENCMEKILDNIRNAGMGIKTILFDQDLEREAFKITVVSTVPSNDDPDKPSPKQPRRRFDI